MAGERGPGLSVATCICAVAVLPSTFCAVGFSFVAVLTLAAAIVLAVVFAS